jgi:hypothetical protein
MFKAFGFSLGLLFLFTMDLLAAPPVDEWQPVTSKDGKITAKFPAAPKAHTQAIDSAIGKLTIKMLIYQSAVPDVAFMTSQVLYPVDPADYDVKAGLRGALEGARGNVQGKIESQKNIKMFGMPGKEAVISTKQGISIKTWIFIDGKGPALYQFQVAGSPKFLKQVETQAFFDSVSVNLKPAKE